jgi:hypothetical protein
MSNESLKWHDLGDVPVPSRIERVELRCAHCGRLYLDLPISGGQGGRALIMNELQNQCRGCGGYSGFRLSATGPADIPDRLNDLANLLLLDINPQITADTKDQIQRLINGRFLSLRLGVLVSHKV